MATYIISFCIFTSQRRSFIWSVFFSTSPLALRSNAEPWSPSGSISRRSLSQPILLQPLTPIFFGSFSTSPKHFFLGFPTNFFLRGQAYSSKLASPLFLPAFFPHVRKKYNLHFLISEKIYGTLYRSINSRCLHTAIILCHEIYGTLYRSINSCCLYTAMILCHEIYGTLYRSINSCCLHTAMILCYEIYGTLCRSINSCCLYTAMILCHEIIS